MSSARAGNEPKAGRRAADAASAARWRSTWRAPHAEVVPATLWDEADVEAWWAAGADVTMRLVRAIAAGCAAVPALNARFDGKAMRRQLPPQSISASPSIRGRAACPGAARRRRTGASAELRREIDALKSAVRSRTLALADLRDPTITLSNFGTLAGRHAALVILPPQVAIIGAGRIAPGGGARDRNVRIPPHAAAVAHLRSPRRHRRRGGAFLRP